MALEFLLPDTGEGLIEAVILRWLVPVGSAVGLDEPMVELETDKAVMDMPAPRAGVILHHGGADGDTLAVGDLLVVIGDPGETWTAGGNAVGAAPSPVTEAAPVVGTLEEASEGAAGVQALPVVRKLAEQFGVDLGGVSGTGPGGRITRADVEAAAAGSGDHGPVERVRLSPTRAAIARNLTRSWQEIPHVTTYGEAAADALLDARRSLAEETGLPVPLEALLIDAVVPLLVEVPEFNASLEGSDLVLRRHYDLGVAVDTPEGLMVAVVVGADGRNARGLAAEVSRLAVAARERTISPDDLRGATFTVSNIGAVGGRYGTPIIPYGTTAILSMGRADPAPAVSGDRVVVARRFPLSLSYDHRVIDGGLGRRFMGGVIDALETYGRG
jgi:pyruvate dehydrogenase E2 component (dihydrolipoamide acetyltransferase)